MSGPISISGDGLRFDLHVGQWSIGNVGECRLVDYATITPSGSFSDPQLRLMTNLATCVWGQRGHFWLEQTLTAGGTVHFLTSGAGMSMAFDNSLYWQPVRDLRINIDLRFNGSYDNHSGWAGSIGFSSNVTMIDAKSVFVGAGIRF
jgi:hypothetical protein